MMMRTAGAEVMRIKSDGKVGIGINDPTDILHVYGSSEIGSISWWNKLSGQHRVYIDAHPTSMYRLLW